MNSEYMYICPVDVSTRTEIFKGFGLREMKRLAIVAFVFLIPYWLLGIPKTVKYEEVPVDSQQIEMTYDENGENLDIEKELNSEIEQEELLNSDEVPTEEVAVTVDLIPANQRIMLVIIPVVITVLLSLPLMGRVSGFTYIGYIIKFKRMRKRYYFERIKY